MALPSGLDGCSCHGVYCLLPTHIWAIQQFLRTLEDQGLSTLGSLAFRHFTNRMFHSTTTFSATGALYTTHQSFIQIRHHESSSSLKGLLFDSNNSLRILLIHHTHTNLFTSFARRLVRGTEWHSIRTPGYQLSSNSTYFASMDTLYSLKGTASIHELRLLHFSSATLPVGSKTWGSHERAATFNTSLWCGLGNMQLQSTQLSHLLHGQD